MFQTSADILHLILSISIAVLTFFLCWALYYIISGVGRIRRILKKIELGVDKAEALIDSIKEKMHSGASYIMMAGELIKKVSEIARSKYEKHSGSKMKKTAKKGK